MSASADEALKAIEVLTDIIAEELTGPAPDPHRDNAGRIRRRLLALRLGCEALRAGARGKEEAQAIIQYPDPPEAPSQLQPGSAAAPADSQMKKSEGGS